MSSFRVWSEINWVNVAETRSTDSHTVTEYSNYITTTNVITSRTKEQQHIRWTQAETSVERRSEHQHSSAWWTHSPPRTRWPLARSRRPGSRMKTLLNEWIIATLLSSVCFVCCWSQCLWAQPVAHLHESRSGRDIQDSRLFPWKLHKICVATTSGLALFLISPSGIIWHVL